MQNFEKLHSRKIFEEALLGIKYFFCVGEMMIMMFECLYLISISDVSH